MPNLCDLRLTSYEPIVEALVRFEHHCGGWKVWLRHRHWGGSFSDCGVFELAGLTLEELEDVLLAELSSWDASAPHLTDG
jgi:hypothetical protein